MILLSGHIGCVKLISAGFHLINRFRSDSKILSRFRFPKRPMMMRPVPIPITTLEITNKLHAGILKRVSNKSAVHIGTNGPPLGVTPTMRVLWASINLVKHFGRDGACSSLLNN